MKRGKMFIIATQSLVLMTLGCWKIIVGKGQNAGNYHVILSFIKPQERKCWKKSGKKKKMLFSAFSTMFFTIPKTNFNFSVTFISTSSSSLNLDHS